MHWFYKTILTLNKFPIEAALAEYQSLISKNPNCRQRAFEVFDEFRRTNKFYQDFLKSKGVDEIKDWEKIPTISKKDFNKDLMNILSNWELRDIHFHNTSGSSGTPFKFAKNKFCHAMTWSHIDAKLLEHGIDVGCSLQARFYGIPLSRSKYYKEKIKDFLANRVRFNVFDLSDSGLERIIAAFRKKPFDYINGYTNSLVIFAKYLINKDLVLKDLCPSLKCAITTSEVCDDLDKKTLEKGFGVKVINEYGSADSDLIALEDVDGDFVLNEETLFVEILNDNNQPVSPGELGRVVVTSLYNKIMPFIRYEIGDLAVLKDKFKIGRRVIDKVLGRTNDLIKLPSGKISPGFTLYYVVKELITHGSNISEYLIRQKTLDLFVFEYVAKNPMSIDEEMKLVKIMREYLEGGVNVNIKKVSNIERAVSGKRKHFISEI